MKVSNKGKKGSREEERREWLLISRVQSYQLVCAPSDSSLPESGVGASWRAKPTAQARPQGGPVGKRPWALADGNPATPARPGLEIIRTRGRRFRTPRFCNDSDLRLLLGNRESWRGWTPSAAARGPPILGPGVLLSKLRQAGRGPRSHQVAAVQPRPARLLQDPPARSAEGRG